MNEPGDYRRHSLDQPAPVEGFDLSIYVQGGDWQLARARSGREFAFIECARGTTLGAYFPAQWEACGQAGFIRGTYQRLFSTFSAEHQAETFLAAVDRTGASLEPTDLPPVLDAEFDDDSHVMAVQASAFAEMLHVWVERVGSAFGRRPLIYTGPNFWNCYMSGMDEFAGLPLWLCQWNVAVAAPPQPWNGWTFWQYAAERSVPGFDHPVDYDRFVGSRDELLRFIASTHVR